MASPYPPPPGGFASPAAPPGGPPSAPRPAQPGTASQAGTPQGSPYAGGPGLPGANFASPMSASPGYAGPHQPGPPGPSPRPPSQAQGRQGSLQAPYNSSPSRPGGPYMGPSSQQVGEGGVGRPGGPQPLPPQPGFPGPSGAFPRAFGTAPQAGGPVRPAAGGGQFAQGFPTGGQPQGPSGSSGAAPFPSQAGFPAQRPSQGPPPTQAGPAPAPYYGPPGGGPPAYGAPPAYTAAPQQLQGAFQNLQIGSGSPSATAQHPPAAATGPAGPPRRVYPQAYTTGGPAGVPPPATFAGPAGLTALAPPGQPRMSSQPRTPTSQINPEQMPRPQPADAIATFETRFNNTANLPPPATSNFLVRDTGNCSPRVMRPTLNQVPASEDLMKTSGLALAVVVQPLALQDPREAPIAVIDAGESGPVRCGRCKAYMNPFMVFVDQGRHFTCNFCHFKNETPREYMMNLGPDGRRRDVLERPELCCGSVEYVASAEYMVRPPMPHSVLFLIDVSLNAVTTGSTAASCSAVARAVAELPDAESTRVGVATFDSSIHFYNISPSLAQPQMLIVPDVADPYTPLPAGLAVPLPAARQHLLPLLDSIPAMFAANRVGDSAMGSAVKAAMLALKATGGKILVFQAVLPSVGIGSLSAREAEGRGGAVVGEKDVNKLLQPADKALEKLATEAAEFQVAVDLFLTGAGYMDVASLSVLPRLTGGSLISYQPFNAAVDSAKLYNDLRWNLTRPQGLEAVMRVRCSQGLQVSDYSGHFCRRIPTDVDLPAVDCDKAVLVAVRHEEKLAEPSEAAFQCALLYTTTAGQRRIRVHTLSLPVSTQLGSLFRGADLDAHFTYLLKSAAADVPRLPVAQLREQVTAATVGILYAYRKHCATSSSAGQLILPEALKLLPLYALGLTKSPGLRTDVRIDERAAWLAKVAPLPAPLAVPLVYPRMFAVHKLQDEGGSSSSALPPVVALSSEKLEHEGVYLLENGEDAWLWAGKAAAPEVVGALFGVRSLDQVAPGQLQLQRRDNPLSQRLNDVVDEIRRQRCSYLRLRILKRGDPLEPAFFQCLVEDKAQYGQSYVEYLIHIHRQIQNKFN